MAYTSESARPRDFGLAWLLLCLAFLAHVIDEAWSNFLSVYNPAVLALRLRNPWFPMPVFEFREWLIGLIAVNLFFLALTPFALRNSRWLRPLAYFFAAIHFLNGIGHTLGTMFGSPFPEVHFPHPVPGFYSSPLLIAASMYLFISLRRSTLSRKTT
ncbi:MAG TPA: hypothetical protein VOA41_15395 [Candidatus Dormibacteraeota bacterium]|nr:hypothetical protein [Candidatus Dormibacteraeota bacterium]